MTSVIAYMYMAFYSSGKICTCKENQATLELKRRKEMGFQF